MTPPSAGHSTACVESPIATPTMSPRSLMSHAKLSVAPSGNGSMVKTPSCQTQARVTEGFCE